MIHPSGLSAKRRACSNALCKLSFCLGSVVLPEGMKLSNIFLDSGPKLEKSCFCSVTARCMSSNRQVQGYSRPKSGSSMSAFELTKPIPRQLGQSASPNPAIFAELLLTVEVLEVFAASFFSI